MSKNKTPPGLVWFDGHLVPKEIVDRINAETELERGARLANFAAVCSLWPKQQAENGGGSRDGQATNPQFPQSDPIKDEAKSATKDRVEAILSGQIKANAETLRVDASPGNAGTPAGRGGGWDSRRLADGRAEKVYGGNLPESGSATCTNSASRQSGSVPSAMPTDARPPSDPRDSLPPSRSALPGSDQIKANAQFRPRKGKIAGLPEEIREALNERLENGEEGKALLEWLNGLPEVKHYLAAEFEGAPILEQNLSAWRKGGYADWLERNALVEVGLRLQENVAEWKEAGDLDLPQVLGHWLTGQYALATRNMGDLQGHEKWAQLWRIGRGVMRLRQVQEQEEKVKLAEARFAWKQEREAKRAEERAIVRALRAEEKAKRPRRREPTEEETEEAAQECREIFKPETEEDRAYYYKLRRDAEVADALARGEEPPPEPVPIMEQECSTHVTKGRYF